MAELTAQKSAISYAGEGFSEILRRPRKKGKALLVVPSQANVYGVKIKPAYPALGVLSVAAALEAAGHEVAVIDSDADNLNEKKISEEAYRGGWDVVGITSATATYPNALKLARLVKEKSSGIITVLGGIHATVDAANCAKEKAFDFIVRGEGESTAIELMDAITSKAEDFSMIRGITCRDKNGDTAATAERGLAADLDDLPHPAWHLIRGLNRYAPADATFLPAAPIMVSRGCPGRCTYCNTKNIFGRALRFRSAENVLNEIRQLVYKYSVREVHFLDDVITGNRKFVFDLCALLKKEPYKLRLEVANGLRADMVDKEILTALKEAGLANVGFGVETGNDRVLESIKKGITKEQCRRAFSIAKEAGLETWGFFIIGLPADDKKSIMDTIDFAVELDPKYAKFLILKPFPGTEAYLELAQKGLILNKDYARYGVYTAPVHRLETLNSRQIFALQKAAYRKFYFRPAKIIEHLMGIRSPAKLISAIRGVTFIIARAFK